MTARERWAAVLTHRRPDRVPMDYWATPEFSARLVRHLGLSNRPEPELVADLKLPPVDNNLSPSDGFSALRRALRQLDVDFVVKVVPRYVGPPLVEDTDEFGCRHRQVDYGSGSYDETITHPLADCRSVAEIERDYVWPSPDWWDYSCVADQVRGWEQHPIRAGGSEPFLTYKELRGEEQAYIDLTRNPEVVRYCLDRLFDLCYANTRRLCEQLPRDILLLSYISEDLGGQNGLLIAPEHVRTFLLPRMRRMVELARAHGAHVFHHDDGGIARILPELVEMGIEVLNPIQWRAQGMDREWLKRTFGGRLVFHGGMDNQQTLPFGTPAQVREEVAVNIRLLGAGGGYVLAPCHNIQAITPPENVVAMYEAVRAAGRY
jgi:uroporphyrinogen decarboxylase